ncbi:hypothetical protein KBB96_07055 [Luteolibacter ambystomatis]|uniref:Uncharacterized protein n=1 Tax=Luteolibacter ambystomatis TaxID=2824561 RepID=A0A975PGV1_9BACT|nr:hypothetical protein [Luteolibacter ambystomatis]QUE52646.1 hypothetical protein KBB96_07055 [Luteolibacter ambystomatis]
MHLERCQEQSQRTLDQFYEEFLRADHSPSREGARTMLGLIHRLRALNDPRRVHGRTSHFMLCLLATDHSLAPPHVTIHVNNGNGFRIDYLMPAHTAPWPGARVTAEAWTEDEALGMVLEAMDLSGGWSF